MQIPVGRAAAMGRALCFVAAAIAFTSTSASAQVNSWINPTSGNWDDPVSWSLGELPDGSQSVQITNSGWKAVAINPSTPVNYPNSMTVNDLTVRGAWDTENVLLLNYFGTDVPLTVLNGLTLQDDGRIVNFGSGLVVQSGTILVTNSQFIQDGGLVCTTNALMNLSYAQYQLTNGVFQGGTVVVGYPVNSAFNQFGGAVSITNLVLGPGGPGAPYPHGGAYALYGGYLNLPGGLSLGGQNGQSVSYLQEGGSNQTTSVYIEAGIFGNDPGFTLNGGLLADNNVSIVGDGFGGPTIQQNGGTHVVSNSLAIVGGAENGYTPLQSTYQLNGGTLSAANISLNGDPGPAAFNQTNGTTQAGQINAAGYWYEASVSTYLNLSGGTLTCSNLFASDGGHINQSGGVLVVSNLLSFGGYSVPQGPPPIYTKYTFTDGTLIASNINVGGDWIIGDGRSTRISNPGFISLSHTLQISNATEQLGGFILATNATIDLAGEASKLSFADSSAEVWNSSAKLSVTNWNWLTSQHYLGDQLKFGSNQFGLTAAQVQRIHFINPDGYAPGDYAAQMQGDGTVTPGAPASSDITNDWTGADGYWHDLTWSLGVRPDSSQTVRIIGGNRTVTVNATTAANYPASLTVHDFVLSGDAGTATLVLSNAGTATPLRALNGLVVEDGAKLVNLNSGLVADGAVLTVTNAQMSQDGGFIRTTNATLHFQNAEYDLTNGLFEAGTVLLGEQVFSRFNQFGGMAVISDLYFGPYPPYSGGGNYSLYGGNLSLPNGLSLYSDGNSSASYFQAGGTNRTTTLSVEDGRAYLTLNGGLLADNSAVVMAGYYGNATIEQNGGAHVITNGLSIAGGAHNSYAVHPATYTLNNGTLSASLIELNANQGDSVFVQTNGTTSTGTFYAHSQGFFGEFNDYITVAGGALSCSNFTLDDGAGSFNQSDGVLVVSNLLTITGYRDLNIRYYGTYILTGGSVTASNINISGNLIIGDGSTNRISNPGFFSLSHLLQISNATEQLGGFILASNATIDLAGSASQLSFANSSGEAWAGGATLVIADWNGDPSGGGAEQLKFGTDQSGLTAAQLNQIQFRIGTSTNFYPAKILSTGEVVPDTSATPSVAISRQGNNLILTWPSGWSLQSATNAAGPYFNVPESASPYTIDTTAAPQQFFRLSQ